MGDTNAAPNAPCIAVFFRRALRDSAGISWAEAPALADAAAVGAPVAASVPTLVIETGVRFDDASPLNGTSTYSLPAVPPEMQSDAF